MSQENYMKGVALITGAASGIGRATAHTFVKEGCSRLVLGDLDYTGLQRVAEELKARNAAVRTVIVSVDVSSEEQVEALIDAGVQEFGAVHYAVNNAGITSNPRVRTHELPTSSWDQVVDVNLRGAWLCERAELRQMMKQEAELKTRTGAPQQRGAIVNISSLFGVMSHPTVGAYSATKAGILGMTRTDALAYAADGVRVNSVLPGFVKTPMVEESIRRGANYEELIGSVPVRRWGHPEEIAEAVVFLVGEKASLINGVSLVVDGGKQFVA
ncbi:short chain dehydrogenase/ reductase [Aspergillus pseudoustus]|uniref:Short chain dehydrogenase/ reductase n=1 Tax=Aspergillus pseudoustus TaxID=1810923 RepID=A0ABR4ITD2_9EURO